jgi:predicted dehydrogenase/threonine dehydrogenase-like Zn-dependent dehydrogenase
MKQLLQNLRTGRASVEEVPPPEVRPRTALVRTAASLVSAGTERMVVDFARQSLLGKARRRPDLVKQVLDRARREGLVGTARSAFRRLDQPMALGYSSAGTIVALGEEMPGFRVGQRVACAGGGYAVHAEYAVVPRNLLAVLPGPVDFESAAFAAVGAIAMHGFRLAQPQAGERVAVIGLGLLGLLGLQIASAAGCAVFGIDVAVERVRLAASFGCTAVLRSRAIAAAQAFTKNRGFDVVLICADTPSNDPVELAAVIARDRARVVAVGAVGLTLPRRDYYEKELSFINSRSYGPGRYDASYEAGGNDYPIGYVRWTEGRNLEAVVELMATGELQASPLITHRIPIGRAADAYELISSRKGKASLGVLLTYESTRARPPRTIEFPTAHVPKSDVRLGVIGAGNFAEATFLPAMQKAGGIQLVGIASEGGLHAQHAAVKYGFSYATSSLEQLLGDGRVNTVAVLTRHDSHAALVLRALKAGKHVFVEKPLAVNEQELKRLQSAARRAGRQILMVGFNRRFSPLGAMLADFLSDRPEPLHAHYRVNAGYLPLDHWTQDPASGGRIVGEACHFVDFITFLVGSPPTKVSASALPDNGRYREDNASMTFGFEDGSVGVVDYLANGDRSVPKERLEVFCAAKVAVLDDFRSLELVLDGSRRLIRKTQDKGWLGEWRAFSRAIREGGQPPIPYVHLVGVTGATLAAVRSIRNQETVSI